MDTARLAWVVSALLAFLGGVAIVGNYSIAILWCVRRKRASMIPLLGGVFFAGAMLILPLPAVGRWAWIPLVADLGCVPLFGGCVYHYLLKRRDDNHAA
jgi:hypothetical protein